MSKWITGWFKGGASEEETAPAAAVVSIETPEQIRAKRLARLEAASAASAAAAAAAAAAAPAPKAAPAAKPAAAATTHAQVPQQEPQQTSQQAIQPAGDKASAAPALSSEVSPSVSAAPAAAVQPSAAASTAHLHAPAAASVAAAIRRTPPASPAAAAKPTPASPSTLSIPASAASSAASSPAKPSRPSIHAVPPTAYAILRSPLPISLLVGFTAGPGVTPEVLARAWEHQAFGEVFAVTVVDPAAGAAGVRGTTGRTYLKGLASEMVQASPSPPDENASMNDAAAGEPAYTEPTLLLHRAHLDSVLMERLTQQNESAPGTSLFGWLLSSYRRAQELDAQVARGHASAVAAGAHSSSVYPSAPADWQTCAESLRVALSCVARYIGLSLSDEEMFQDAQARQSARSDFLRLLCSDPNVSRTLPAGLLDHLVATYEAEAESFNTIFQPLAAELATPPPFLPPSPLSRLGETMPSLDVALPKLHGLAQFFRFAPLAALVTLHPSFLPRVPSGRMLQTASTLGVLMSVGASSSEPLLQGVFSARRQQYEVESEVTRLRTSLASYQQLCAQVWRSGVKHAGSRESLLQWLSVFVSGNAVRRRMQFHPLETCSDSLCFSVMHVALALAAPIVKRADKASFDKVDLAYLLQGPGARIDYDNITRVHATAADVKAVRAVLSPLPAFKFTTECFFLTHALLHECLGSIVRQYTEIMQEVSRQSRALQRMPPDSPQAQHAALQLDRMFAASLASRVHLQDPALTNAVIQFFNWTAQWILVTTSAAQPIVLPAQSEAGAAAAISATTAASAASAPASAAAAPAGASATPASSLPSSSSPHPLTLASLIPEPTVELLVEYIVYLGRFQSTELLSLAPDSYASILELVVALAAGPLQLKNPHLRSSLAEILLSILPIDHVATESHVFATMPSMCEKLVPALLDLYVSIESERGFYYMKFNARHQINVLLEFLWAIPAHRARVLQVAADTSSGSLFTRFTNCLINDLIFLLDEGLRTLHEIRATQLAMEQSQSWAAQPADVRAERERSYAQNEQGATSSFTLANATVHLLFYLSSEVVAPFVAPEFVERMAHLLDYYIVMLVGPKITELKVNDRDKYHFKPRELLQEIIGAWLNLSSEKAFLEKVATDERSYRPAVFAKAARILRKRAILPERTIQRFESQLAEVASLSETLLALEDILGDIPDQYQDGLMGTLMTDPVQLPQSKQFVDRSTINRQLMNKAVDPFSNTPLTVDMLVEQPALKVEIEAWVESRKAQWREAKQKQQEAEASAQGADDDDDDASSLATESTRATSAQQPAASASTPAADSKATTQRKSYLDD